jgi:putative FmdB family regulatory protein
MPIYEYNCEKCGKMVDVLQKMNDPAPKKCEACGAKGKMTRVVSRTSFVLKGGGWYSDLYGSKKKDSTSASSGTSKSASSPTASAAPASGAATSSTPAPAAAADKTAPAAKASTDKK